MVTRGRTVPATDRQRALIVALLKTRADAAGVLERFNVADPSRDAMTAARAGAMIGAMRPARQAAIGGVGAGEVAL